MQKLLTKLDVGSRLMNKNVVNISKTQGHIELNKELTEAYSQKIEFIIRYITLLQMFLYSLTDYAPPRLILISKEGRKRHKTVIEQL